MRQKRIFCFFFAFALLLTFLNGCGSPPSSFVLSTDSKLEYVSWNNDNGQLSGTLVQVDTSMLYPGGKPSVTTIPITGTLSNNHVTLDLHSSIFTTTLTGDIDDSGKLQIASADSAGRSSQVTWYGISKEDYDSLVTAFDSHAQLQQFIEKLNDDSGINAASDSSSSSADYQVQQDQATIDDDKGLVQDLQNGSYSCLSALFGLNPVYDNFQLSSDVKEPSFATVDSDFRSVQQQWKSTKEVAIPQVDVPMPWKVTQDKIDSLANAVDSLKKAVISKIASDQKQLDQLKNQYNTLKDQYNQIYNQKCGGSNGL